MRATEGGDTLRPMTEFERMMTIDRIDSIVKDANETAIDKGFWDGYDGVDDRFPEAIALIHSENSEALEAHRRGDITNVHADEDYVMEELADSVIRILDLAGQIEKEYEVEGKRSCRNFAEELIHKMEKNKGREYKHGKRY